MNARLQRKQRNQFPSSVEDCHLTHLKNHLNNSLLTTILIVSLVESSHVMENQEVLDMLTLKVKKKLTNATTSLTQHWMVDKFVLMLLVRKHLVAVIVEAEVVVAVEEVNVVVEVLEVEIMKHQLNFLWSGIFHTILIMILWLHLSRVPMMPGL